MVLLPLLYNIAINTLESQSKSLKDQLRSLLSRKQSNTYYAFRLGVTEGEIEVLRNQIKQEGCDGVSSVFDPRSVVYINNSLEGVTFKNVSRKDEKDSVKVDSYYDHPPTPEEVFKDHNMDPLKWVVNGMWSKAKGSGWLVSIFFKPIPIQEDHDNKVLDFLRSYEPASEPVFFNEDRTGDCGLLLFPKQDLHHNKHDIYGDNDIIDRFRTIERSQEKIISEVNATKFIEKVIYVIGSDAMNSEAGVIATTTKGTPQQNILPFHVALSLVCNHEARCVMHLLQNCKEVHVVYVPGNHDRNASWNIIHWLQAYFRNEPRVTFDIGMGYTKYIRYHNNAFCLNHFDVIKPEKLAQNFPEEFREYSLVENKYIIGGDKHTELTREIGGSLFIRVGCLSNSVSDWDSQMGFGQKKGIMNAFFFSREDGMTNVYKDKIK